MSDRTHLTDAERNDLLDGELDRSERTRCERHVAACASCRHEIDELRSLLSRARDLAQPRPRRDLLAAARNEAGRTTPRSRWFALAATFLLPTILAVGWYLGRASAPEPLLQPALAELHDAERQFTQATAELLEALEQRSDRIPAATLEAFRNDLAALDAAIFEARAALVRNTDPRTERALTALHEKKMETVWKVQRLTL